MKIVSIILRVLAILGAAAAVAGYVLTQNKVNELNEQLAQEQSKATAAQQQATSAQDELSNAKSKVSGLSSDLGAVQERETKARNEFNQAQREIKSLQSDLKDIKSKVADLEQRNNTLKRELLDQRTSVPTDNSAEISQYQAKIEALNKQVMQLKTDLDAATARTSGSTAAAAGTAATGTAGASSTVAPSGTPDAPATTVVSSAAKGQSATILKADHDNGILIISRGQQGGLQRQMEFGIVKGVEKPIRLTVTRVEPDFAIAHIAPGTSHAKIYKEGDTIQIVQ